MNILRAEHFLKGYGNGSSKLAEFYDDDDMLSSVMNTLFPGFEYPDFSHLTLDEIRSRYFKAPQSQPGC
jgi:hypothetical protein